MADLNPEEARYYLRLFRSARYAALQDAEDYLHVCYALEELGRRLIGRPGIGLGAFKAPLLDFIGNNEHMRILFDQVRRSRNDSAHTGVYARNSSKKATLLCMKIEERLVDMLYTAQDLMSEGVVFAEPFFSLSKVCEIMLESSYSFLPIVRQDDEGKKRYYFVSDFIVAKKLSTNNGSKVSDLELNEIDIAIVLSNSTRKEDLLLNKEYIPRLVADNDGHIVGIITAFDLL